MQVGVLEAATEELNWVVTLVGRRMGVNIGVRSVLPSDDGAYIAVAGWDNSVAMIDVQAKDVMWVKKPADEAALKYVAFSPDGEVVYAGGTMGVVYTMDVRTGRVLGRWCAALSGASEYGHRISCLAASADGRWVAAGTGPEGLVFVASTADSRRISVLDHGGSTILLVQFSPDSTALASFVPGSLKIWNMPKEDGE